MPYAGIVRGGAAAGCWRRWRQVLQRGAAFAIALVVGLHLVAMNVLYPKLVGARVHLNPLVVTFSLMFWGFLWDAAGLLLAIPITAGMKAVCDNVAGLRKFGRFLGD